MNHPVHEMALFIMWTKGPEIGKLVINKCAYGSSLLLKHTDDADFLPTERPVTCLPIPTSIAEKIPPPTIEGTRGSFRQFDI